MESWSEGARIMLKSWAEVKQVATYQVGGLVLFVHELSLRKQSLYFR